MQAMANLPPIVIQQSGALEASDATARLPGLSGLPTLVLNLERGIIFPSSYGRKLAAGTPGAKFVEADGAVQGVTIQCADGVNRELLEHFISVSELSV